MGLERLGHRWRWNFGLGTGEGALRGGRRSFGGWLGEDESSVPIDDGATGNGRDTLAGDDDTGQVHGVGGGYLDLDGGVGVAGGAEALDGLRQGELLATEAGDEAAAADLAAGFEATEDAEEVAPFGGVRLAGEEVAEEDSIAREEHASGGFESRVELAGVGDGLFAELFFAGSGVGWARWDGGGISAQ